VRNIFKYYAGLPAGATDVAKSSRRAREAVKPGMSAVEAPPRQQSRAANTAGRRIDEVSFRHRHCRRGSAACRLCQTPAAAAARLPSPK